MTDSEVLEKLKADIEKMVEDYVSLKETPYNSIAEIIIAVRKAYEQMYPNHMVKVESNWMNNTDLHLNIVLIPKIIKVKIIPPISV